MMNRYPLLGLAGTALALILGCQGLDHGASPSKLLVAVSIIPQAWLVEQLGGEHVEVVTLVNPGESHELYQPSDAHVSRLMRAAVYFRIGVGAEDGPWFEALRAQKRLKIVDLRRGIPALASPDHADHAGADPHIWLSPRLLKRQAHVVAETLIQVDPSYEADYRRNLSALQQRLDQCDAAIGKMLRSVRGKAFFVYHPAWGYFARDYGLRQVALETEGKEPGDEELTRLQQQAKQEGVKVIFVQPQISSRAAQALASAIGGRVGTLDPLAPDVPANLIRVAEAIAASYR